MCCEVKDVQSVGKHIVCQKSTDILEPFFTIYRSNKDQFCSVSTEKASL